MQTTTVADIGNVRHKLDGSVLVDRTWARHLGASQAKGARRVGNFYRLPKAQYVRLIEGVARNTMQPGIHVHPNLRWTATDDLAVANMLEESAQAASGGQPAESKDSECVGCS